MSKVAVDMLGSTVATINAIIRIASKFNSVFRRPKASQDSTNFHEQKYNTDTITGHNISTNIILTKFS